MDANITYPVFEVSDVNQVIVFLSEEDIKSLELNDFEVSGAKLVDSAGYEILIEGEAKQSESCIIKMLKFFRGGETITITGRGSRDLNSLKSIVLNYCKVNQIESTDDWDCLLEKIRLRDIIW